MMNNKIRRISNNAKLPAKQAKSRLANEDLIHSDLFPTQANPSLMKYDSVASQQRLRRWLWWFIYQIY
jgi:hypothetical protein